MSRVVGCLAFFAALVFEDTEDGVQFVGAEERRVAGGARAEALFDANDFAAVEAVGGHGKERMLGGHTIALALCEVFCRVGGEERIGLEFQSADGGVEVREGSRGAVHGFAAD